MPVLPLIGPLKSVWRTPSSPMAGECRVPVALPATSLPLAVVAYRMPALVIVLQVALRRAVSVAEPTRSMPPQSPAGMIEGHDCTKTDGQLWMLTLSRKLVKTFVPGSPAFSAAPVRLIAPFDFTTLPPGTANVPLL